MLQCGNAYTTYGDYAGSFSLESGEILAGQMPPVQMSKIKQFIQSNQVELMEKWKELTD